MKESTKEVKKETEEIKAEKETTKKKDSKGKSSKKNAKKKGLSKKNKIIISVVAVLLAVGVGLGLYFGLKDKTSVHATTYGDTIRSIDVVDASTIEFEYVWPYFENQPQAYVENAKGVYVTYTDTNGQTVTINGEIIEAPKYSKGVMSNGSQQTEGGYLTLKVKLDKKLLNEETEYRVVLKAGSISYKDDNYVNQEISGKFVASSIDGISYNGVTDKPYADAKAVVPSNVEISLTKDSEKGYFSISAYIPGVTQFNAVATQNFSAIAKIEYKNDGTFVRFISTDVEFKEENGKVFLKGSIGLDDLIPGKDYTVTIQKGVFINDDKTIVNEEYICNYTYVE